ncbi:MAG: hypothetical protein CMP49_04645 [Flavobacteriales bacterium]|nr:hypothetical protein [Flavobacteriales bacterium]
MTLQYTGLINTTLITHTQNTLTNGEELSFYIDKASDNRIGWQSLNKYFIQSDGNFSSNKISIFNVGHNITQQQFIRNTLNRLDNIIDLDFIEMPHNNGSMLDIYHISYASTFEENVIGEALSQRSNAGYWWDILWRNTDQKINSTIDGNYNTIIHEIGHTLGLGHPFNDPTNTLWTSSDTVMSYNRGPEGWDDWFSQNDLNALISIWGREDDQGYITYEKNSSDYKFIQSLSKDYTIQTEVGLEKINDSETLIFLDKSMNVKNDIIDVFNIINGIDDITGKIYRLYNAAFNRFPDKIGLQYWVEKNKSGQDSYRDTAASFINSQEFLDLYGSNSSDTTYINNLYLNILNRLPDQEGFNYWMNQLDNSLEDRSELLMGFSESQENKSIFSNETSIY